MVNRTGRSFYMVHHIRELRESTIRLARTHEEKSRLTSTASTRTKWIIVIHDGGV